MRVSSHNEVKFWNGFGNCFIYLIARMAKSNGNLVFELNIFVGEVVNSDVCNVADNADFMSLPL